MWNMTMPITKTAASRSRSTPASTITGMKSVRSRPKTKTPFSSTRNPSTWVTAFLRLTTSSSPVQTVASAVGTRKACISGVGSGSPREKANARATPAPPSSMEGT